MLARYPELNTKILPLMEDYLVALRSTIAIVLMMVATRVFLLPSDLCL